MGTDSGPPGRFQGYFEHLELQMMKDSGMPVKEILVSSTSLAAECMNIHEITGTVEKGKKADFLVLEENPLESLDNLRKIRDRKSTRLNSSHVAISYAVFCLKKT